MLNSVRRLLTLGVTTAAAIALTVLPADAAPAPAPSTTTFSIPVTTPTRPAVPNVITCTLSIAYPHNSHHMPGNVLVAANIQCSAAVKTMTISVRLYRTGTLVAVGGDTRAASPRVNGNAYTACVPTPATYQGVTQGTVTFPDGSVPPVANLGPVASGIATLGC